MVHNFYRSCSPSGENQVFVLEKALLEKKGHQVEVFARHSDEIAAQGVWGSIKGASSTSWNPFSAKQLRRRISSFKPHVVHVHNTFPLISPSVFASAKEAARVYTLHNYRLFCAAAIPMRASKICTECLDRRSVLPAMRFGCYRNSRVATIPLAVGIAVHRRLGTWQRDVEAFVTLSEFQRRRFVKAGLPAERVYVKANFYPGDPVVTAWPDRADRVVFVGRLSAEKGVRTLLRAWRLWGEQAPRLRIVGDGELRVEMEEMARGLPVEFSGRVDSEQAQAEIGQAKLLIVPSEWFEGFPMVLREAFALGTAVAVSRIGALPDLIRDPESGGFFEPGDAESLLSTVRRAWNRPALLERWSRGAREAFRAKYTEDANYAVLLDIYHAAIRRARKRDLDR